MKGDIYECRVSEGTIAAIHGMTYTVRRLIIPSEGNLCLTPDGNEMHVFRFANFDATGPNVKYIGTVEVPNTYVILARNLIEARENIKLAREDIVALIGEPGD